MCVLKFFNKPVYYSHLLLKKIIIVCHNIFESHVLAQKINRDEFTIFLWQKLIIYLSFNTKGFYFKTIVTNRNLPMALSQARVILILCNKMTNAEPKFRSTFLIKKMTEYLISMRESNGLFKFNQASWNLQDEGIASVWAAMALIKSFEITKEQLYLDTAVSTFNAMLKLLYTKKTSLVHTYGDDYWTVDAASIFAYVCSLLIKYNYSREIEEAMIDSINLCIENIKPNGQFLYCEIRDFHLLLYHPIVIITLEYCLESEHVEGLTRKRLIETLIKAKEFLINSFDKNNKLFEPGIKRFNQYIISQVTTLHALKGKINSELENSLLNNISTYMKNNKLYLCKDNKDNLYNSDLYKVKDVLLIEVLFWLDLYFN